MTLMEILAAARRDLDDKRGRQWKDDELKGWARESQLEVWSALFRRNELVGAEEGSITYAGNTRHLDVAAALGTSDVVHALHSVADISDGEPGVSLEPGTYDEQHDGDDYRGPARWYLYGSPFRLGLYPVPDETRTLRLLWTAKPALMQQLDDEPDGVPEELHPAIVALLCRLAKVRVGEDGAAEAQRAATHLTAVLPAASRRQAAKSRRVRIVYTPEFLPRERSNPCRFYRT